jgi:hypothetical protein
MSDWNDKIEVNLKPDDRPQICRELDYVSDTLSRWPEIKRRVLVKITKAELAELVQWAGTKYRFDVEPTEKTVIAYNGVELVVRP